jgi:hypothetical protein
MLNLNAPNTVLLDDPANREHQPLDYAINALIWLYWSKAQNNPHLVHIDQHFADAIEAVITYFDAGSNLSAADAATRIREHLAYWRRDLDAAGHPLSQLGRVLRGDPGGRLEYPGPVFLLTFAEVFEGITHEFIVPEWDLNDARSAHTLIALAAIVLSEIAVTCYWVLRANGSHLDTELGRLFGPANRASLVGQLGNLSFRKATPRHPSGPSREAAVEFSSNVQALSGSPNTSTTLRPSGRPLRRLGMRST